jgi:hypothetical protein
MSDLLPGTIDWESLTSFSDTFTCYSAAIATWVAWSEEDWPRVVNPGLWLTLQTDVLGGLFGFVHFPPGLGAKLGLVRAGGEPADAGRAVAGVLDELGRNGRVIVAGDGFNLPWHVAFQRRHVPHWFVLADAPAGPTVVDPFACRNELGTQVAFSEPIANDRLAPLLVALPHDDPVALLREALALGDDAGPPDQSRYQWFIRADAGDRRTPAGVSGADAVARLATHFREHGQEPAAYAQTDDIWSIARHRAFLCRHAQALADRRADEEGRLWVEQHAAPLAKRWSHMAPLMMQATLALSAGRTASASVPDTLAELAERERMAARTLPAAFYPARN